MRHIRVPSAERLTWTIEEPERPRSGALNAFAFNVCLVALALACAAAVLITERDRLYDYRFSPNAAHAIAARVERLNAGLIRIDFDRKNQWEDLVAMELADRDAEAARGLVLSARNMLPPAARREMEQSLPADASDADLELAALPQLSPGTRARYQELVPLLSRGGSATHAGVLAARPDDRRDFELMARAVLAEPTADNLQFVLTGVSLGLAGAVDETEIAGAAALIGLSRRDYQQSFGDELDALVGETFSLASFEASAERANAYANLAPAFSAAVNLAAAARLHAALREIGGMSAATSPEAAINLLTHAQSLRDLPRLRLLAQAAGPRAAAAAKRMQRDGRLVAVAPAQLAFNRDLVLALGAAGLGFAFCLALLAREGYYALRGLWVKFGRHIEKDDYGGELMDIGSLSGWRPL